MIEQINLYLDWKRTHVMERSAAMYSHWITAFGMITKKPVEECDIHEISEFSKYLKEKYAPKTAELAMSIVHDFFAFWDRRTGLLVSPQDIKIPKGMILEPRDTITPEEYVTMLTWIKASTLTGLRDNCLLRLLYDTGSRVSEICDLTREDIDLDRRSARVINRKRRDYGRIYWGHDTNEFLRTYIDHHVGKLFPTTRHALRIVQRYVLLAGIKKHIVSHSFRHSKAHRVLDMGGTVKDIQIILRHKSPVSSFKYLELSEGEETARAERFLKGG